MARRKKKKVEKGAPGAPLWMVTYSDMVTLLLTFFVMLLAMAHFEDVGRVQAVLQSIRTALGTGGYNFRVIGAEDEPAEQKRDFVPADRLQPIMTNLRSILSQHVSDNLVKMTQTQSEIRIKLDDRVLFKSGQAKLHPAAYSLVNDLAGLLKKHKSVTAYIEGHTDGTGDPKSNWELSAGRAITLVTEFEKRGPVDGARLEARAFGSHRPSDGNTQNSPWNRRVEIVLQSNEREAYGLIDDVRALPGVTHEP